MNPTPAESTKRSALIRVAGLAAIVLLALGLRAWGLSWGLPDASRYYPYHPDESVLLHAVCSVNPLWFDFTPSFYNYGTFYILVTRLFYDLAAPTLGWGAVPRPDLPFSSWVGDFAHLLQVGRWLAVAMGTGTVLVVFALGRRLYGERTGWIAACLLAIAPMPVMLGHYMAVDTPVTFLIMLALALGAKALATSDRTGLKWIGAAAVVGGLATGTKYNAFPLLFSLAIPLWLIWRNKVAGPRVAVLGAVLAGFLALVAFVLSTPGVVLQPGKFTEDLLYEMVRNKEGQGPIFLHTPTAALFHLSISLPIGMEWPLFLLSLGGLGWSIKKRRPADVYLWLFLIPYFLLLVPAERKFLRYVAPMVPPLILLAARVVDDGLGSRRKGWWWTALAISGGAAAASTVAHLGVISAPDARDQAATYLKRNAQPTQIVALASDGWTYTPPIHPSAGAVKIAQGYGGPPIWDLRFAMGEPREEIHQLPEFKVLAPRSVITPELPTPAGALPVDRLKSYHPDWVVISDYEYEDPIRIKRADPKFEDGRLDLLAALERDYRLEKEFRPRPTAYGLQWWSRGIPPHDWRYYMPTVRLYRRANDVVEESSMNLNPPSLVVQ